MRNYIDRTNLKNILQSHYIQIYLPASRSFLATTSTFLLASVPRTTKKESHTKVKAKPKLLQEL